MNERDQHERVRIRARFWQLFTLLAAILLATTYFMPALNCFDDPRVNPSIELEYFVKDEIRYFAPPLDIGQKLAEWLSHYCVYAAPYLFGVLVAASAATRLLNRRGPQRICAWITAAFFALTALSVIYCALAESDL